MKQALYYFFWWLILCGCSYVFFGAGAVFIDMSLSSFDLTEWSPAGRALMFMVFSFWAAIAAIEYFAEKL